MPAPGTQNATACTPCDAGRYCGATGLTSPSGLISAGYFSLGGSPTATPGFNGSFVTVSYGGVCPAGYFCGPGTITPVACAAGTYLNTTGAVSQSNCTSCPPGVYCSETNITSSAGTGPCDAGWYCTGSATTPQQFSCPIGAACPVGSAAPQSCAPGTYNNLTTQAACFGCPAGYICGAATIIPAACPPGYYCAPGTGSLAAATKCPIGTFSAVPFLSLMSQCQTCTPGSYCDTSGLTAPIGLCLPGYMCAGGNTNARGGDAFVTATPCTAGGWCGYGSISATSCPPGSYSNSSGYSSADNCTLCDDGMYCPTAGLRAPAAQCSPGYWCGRGNDIPNPVGGTSPVTRHSGSLTVTIAVGGDVCPPGSFCLAGSTAPVPCPNGTYYPFSGQGISCAMCPAGFWCGLGFATYNATPCVPGHVCPAGTAYATQFPCPPGTFSNATGLQSVDECTPCSAGSYCAGVGSLAATGPCSPGYVCYGGSSTPTPSDNATGVMCAAGEYCPRGATTVQLCSPGLYCTDPITGVPSGACAPGYYCSAGSWTPTPAGELSTLGTPIGSTCPKGHYCGNATSIPQHCPLGTYSNHSGNVALANCTTCLAGWQCNATGLVVPTVPCAPRYYCPSGTITVR